MLIHESLIFCDGELWEHSFSEFMDLFVELIANYTVFLFDQCG